MRFVRYDDDQLGLLTDDGTGVIDVGDRLGIDAREPLVAYIEGDDDASAYADADPDHAVEDVTLRAPVGRPGKVVAAPLNYENHSSVVMSRSASASSMWFS